MMNPELPPLEPMLSMQQVRELVPVSHSQLYRLIKAGDFPDPIRIGRSRIAWFRSDIADWMARRRHPPG